MPLVPLPFVIAFLLGILLVRLVRSDQARASPWLAAMVAAYAAQAVLLGLHWGYGLRGVLPFQSVLAAALAPFSWLGFRSFVAVNRRVAIHALPPLLVAGLWVWAPWLIDRALTLIFLGYGVALLRLARRGPDALGRATLDGAISVSHALWVTGFTVIASPVVDLAIGLDLMRDQGRHAGLISGASSLISIALLGWVAALAGKSAPAPALAPVTTPEPVPLSVAETEAPVPASGDIDTVAALDALMRERAPHHDPNLSLERLARRMGLPARSLSGAINRVRGMNVSQYVNEHRVADACRLLTETRTPITHIFLDVGFQTKSNFNREFLRITGASPSAWRQQAVGPASPSDGQKTADC
ncbi:helix-turn-helix domain-containing protein [Acidisoma cellulosilytica]|uniref:Helix-turn-helix domain-containing protein n=1 Tax=Acidisoma cellulosilyticum TaxID=2802395 RepID=A0A964E2G1_9PROT|nr:AraC family transcriptional regulator [Acidisoma cellulosilyticum]MCB8879197.1 helix-turn-helix domain-containing protein [Acidisoma cellulosilyticum]